MTTAQDIISDALVKLGVYAPSETASAADAAQGLTCLNDMLSEWAAGFLSVYQIVPLAIPLAAGTAIYTIGSSGASLIATRPSRVSTGPGAASVTIGGTTTPINVIASGATWRVLQGQPVGSGVPDAAYFQPTYPLATVTVSPSPNLGGTLTLSGWSPLSSFATLATAYALAPGVEEALKTNLAVRLKSYFNDMPLPPAVIAAASASKNALGLTSFPSRTFLPPASVSADAQRL